MQDDAKQQRHKLAANLRDLTHIYTWIMWSPDYKTRPPPPKQLRPRNNNGGGASLIFSCLRGPGSKLFGGRGSQ